MINLIHIYSPYTTIEYNHIPTMQVVSQQLVEQAINDVDGVYSCNDFHIGMSCN